MFISQSRDGRPPKIPHKSGTVPPAAGGAGPVAGAVAGHHGDGVGDGLDGGQALGERVPLRPFSFWDRHRASSSHGDENKGSEETL